MTAEPNIDLDFENNPFASQPGDQPEAASPVVEAAERLKQAAGSNAKRLREAAEAGIRTFRESTDQPAATASPNWDEMRTKLKEIHKEGEVWARENPTAAVAIAAGTGFVLGLLLKR